ncbi:hypothetical protein BaRGS_00011648 [Batillaria attramentaria]|uniref:Ig-like domain-containing protein n=1 Tax=Batillaria attramentaria TaxID=370345 RepID=A0ABD0LCY5_9CAEN
MYDRLCPDSVADERNYTALAMSTVSSNVESQDNTYYNTAPQSEHRDPATSSDTNVENAIVRSDQADVIGCQVTTNVDTWTVQGACLVQKIFSSDSDYICVWSQQRVGNDKTVRMDGQFRLSNFTNEQNLYYTGNCSFNRSLPDEAGNYSYNVNIRPGTIYNNVGTVEIEFPGDPQIVCSEFAVEGTTHTCQCTPPATRPGKPPPSLSWPGFFTTGELQLSNVQRDENGTQFTCQLTWGPDQRIVKTANYTLQVAYGPAKAAIVDSEISPNRTRLTCSVDDVNPAAAFNWTGFDCDAREQNETDDVCVIEVTSDDEGKEITCTATNVVDSSLKASASFSINFRKGSSVPAEVQAFPTVAVAGGAGAAVVVIIIITIVVLVVISKRRKQLEDSHVISDTAQIIPQGSANPASEAEKGSTNHTGVLSLDEGTPYANLDESVQSTHAATGGYGQRGQDNDQYDIAAEEDIRHTEGSQGDVYAVVDKASKKPQQTLNQNVSEPVTSPSEAGYGQRETSMSDPSNDVYAQVDKSSKGGKPDSEKQTQEKEEPKKMTVDSKTSKPIAKPRTTAQTEPSNTADGTGPNSHSERPSTRSAGAYYENVTISSSAKPSVTQPNVATEADDEYNTLMFSERQAQKTDEPNPEYSHLGAV